MNSSSTMSAVATATTSVFEQSSKTPTYTVYEITYDGHVMPSNFISKNRAVEFARDFTDKTSQVYIYKTKCIKVFDSSIIDKANLAVLAEAAEYVSNIDNDEDDEDPDYLPENDQDAGIDETDNYVEIGDFEGLIFEDYGRGYMLRPSSESTFYGEPYLLNGWWVDSQEGWFFKREHYDQLIEYGATYANPMTKSTNSRFDKGNGKSKPLTTQRTTTSGKSKAPRSINFSGDDTSPFTKPRNLSTFAITEYGKGLMVTGAKTHKLVKDKEPYLLGNLGFWIESAKGWFFKVEYLSALEELGAKHIKSEPSDEDEFVCVDSQFTQKPDFEKYGKGHILYADSKYTYSKLGKYFEGGFWMPKQKGWFFKTDAKKAFLAKC
tara:strand:+ start:713 stop:1846 length:1134 start_codon:yes stop_codon:yes gene_type:complete